MTTHIQQCSEIKFETETDTIIYKRPDSGSYHGLGRDAIYTMDIAKASKHRIDVKDVTKYFGNEKAVKGKVFGYLQKMDTLKFTWEISIPSILLQYY